MTGYLPAGPAGGGPSIACIDCPLGLGSEKQKIITLMLDKTETRVNLIAMPLFN